VIPDALHERNLRALFDPIAALLAQPDVSEIMINGPARIYVERAGRIEPAACRFTDADALLSAVRAVAQYAGRDLGPDAPILEARLPDGSRVEAVIAPAVDAGPIVCIRRFNQAAVDLQALVARGSLRADGAELLRAAVRDRRNVLVAGGTGSGKTSLLNALAALIPTEQRVLVIEDARELALPHEHVVHLLARPADARGRGEIGVRQLFKTSLRLRPDRIVVGEVRGGEAFELIQAMTSGHAGCLSTIHATTPVDALARLETLALMAGVPLPLSALRAQVASGVGLVIQTARDASGARRVEAICEVEVDLRGYALRPRYRHQEPKES
jgi:pilus assembly protein CpaF